MGPLRPVVRELQCDAEVVFLHGADRGLQVVLALAQDPDLRALDLGLHLRDGLADELRDLLGLLVADAGEDVRRLWRAVPLAASSMGPGCRAFSGMFRLTARSCSTCQAALRRSSVEEWISICSSLQLTVVSVPLKSNRCEISREAWSTALRTSWRSTSETMSKLELVLRHGGRIPPGEGRSLSCGRPGGCPSGQRERAVKPPAKPTEVRILLLPPTEPDHHHRPTTKG